MDEFSDMPDEILVKILSFLPTKVAVSTSILSKRWEFLWMWLPKLAYTCSRSEPGLRDFISKNLPLHRSPVIESLCLNLFYWEIRPEEIRLWIDTAVSRRVNELIVSSYPDNENIFPSSLFTCNSLVTLKLEDVVLTDVPSMSCLPCLKTLKLNEVEFVDEDLLQDFLSICPVLEDLSVSVYDGEGADIDMKEFTIIVPSLLSLSLSIPDGWVLDGYEIDTPSLEHLKLEDCNVSNHKSLIKNMPKLREAYVHVTDYLLKSVIEPITSVKRLTICSEGVYDGDGIVFNQLEHLNLCVCKEDSSNLLGQLLKDSPNLQVLDISLLEGHEVNDRDGMVCWNQPSSVPECVCSSLQIFKWSYYFGRPQERDIAVYMLKNARHLRTATFLAYPWAYSVSDLEMIKELSLSSRASSSCELVFVQGSDGYLNH